MQIDEVLEGASAVPSVEKILFDGGEPFLYYPVLLHGLRAARRHGFRTAILTNGDWATDESAAAAWLAPIADAGVTELLISDDSFHLQRPGENRGARAFQVAKEMSLPAVGVSAEGESLLYTGRAATLSENGNPRQPKAPLDRCPLINFRNPERIYVDFDGYVFLCHGLTIGSLWWKSLAEVLHDYAPESDPILGPLLEGGPIALARAHAVAQPDGCRDACHLCYLTRESLRRHYPERLAPDGLYGAQESPVAD
jgi:hypothetical protein